MLSGPYAMINELMKFTGKVAHLNISLTYMLEGKNINPTKNDQDRDV
jgi:hypothetical protein